MKSVRQTLIDIYRRALLDCDPAALVSRVDRSLFPARPVDVVAIGKCATSMLDGLSDLAIHRVFVAVPRGYEHASFRGARRDAARRYGDEVHLHLTTHPELSQASFDAGDALVRFARAARNPVVVLLSGGASAAVERPRSPFTRADLEQVNHVLVRSGFSIARVNTVRKHLSAIKGGRLASLLPDNSLTLVLSDVDRGRPELVGSGPTSADPSTNADAAAILRASRDEHCIRIAALLERDATDTPTAVAHEVRLVADNATLVAAASDAATALGSKAIVANDEISGDVDDAAARLVELGGMLQRDQVLIAGGEATVRVAGSGRGGRCFELGARLALKSAAFVALFGASDGIDGNSGAAGVVIDPAVWPSPAGLAPAIVSALSVSDSFSLAPLLGEAIILGATGNNLRDLYLLARH